MKSKPGFIMLKDKYYIFMGDVYYTENAIDKILNTEYNFYGRKGASLITGKPYEEIFAVKGDGDKIRECVEKVENYTNKKRLIGVLVGNYTKHIITYQ